MKFNPFTPTRIVGPGMFSGRYEELKAIEQFLYQAKHNNPQHFLIQGERGIGKSSLFLYVEALAGGTIPGVEGENFKFVTISIDLGGCLSDIDILRALARGAKRAFADLDVLTEKGKKLFDWLTNWEVLGVKFGKNPEDYDFQNLTDDLVYQIGLVLKDVDFDHDGLLILIDEADQPPDAANLGMFVKLFTERLTKQGSNNVALGLAGLPVVLTRLKNSHESTPRLFHTMLLEPLENDERKRVLEIGLENAQERNHNETKVTPNAANLIASLSEGYPHFVQQFAYSSFEADKDDMIDTSDVEEGAFAENGAIHQLGRKYFDEMYYGRIGSDDYRKVLNTMADFGDAWITRKQLIKDSKLKDGTVSNAINALKARDIIVVDDAKQGRYRLPSKSFAAWINAIKTVGARTQTDPSLFDEN